MPKIVPVGGARRYLHTTKIPTSNRQSKQTRYSTVTIVHTLGGIALRVMQGFWVDAIAMFAIASTQNSK